jgi:translation initiation factor IF-3
MDYGKYRYEQSKKAREAKKKQTIIELKEIKLRPKTEEHDFQFKARHAERFLKEGNKAKITMMFRGREMVRMDRGKVLLDRFVEALKDVAVVEQAPKVEGRNMSLILAPKHLVSARESSRVRQPSEETSVGNPPGRERGYAQDENQPRGGEALQDYGHGEAAPTPRRQESSLDRKVRQAHAEATPRGTGRSR